MSITTSTAESKHLKAGQRLNIMKEILDTEKNYIEELDILEEYYSKPLRELIGKQKFITKELHAKIFKGDLVIIRKTNGELSNELIENFEMERSNKVPNKTFGQIFLQYAPFIKGYTRYFNEFDNINATLEDIRKNNKPLQQWMDDQRREAKNKPLGGLLITPIQRVPRYKLLLTELVKYTSPYNKDFQMLQNALKEISEVATELNKKITENQNRARLYAIGDMIKGRERLIDLEPNKQIVKPGRMFLQELNLTGVYSKKYNVNISNCVLLIFNNMFVLCKNNDPSRTTMATDSVSGDGRVTYDYEHFEFIFEPVICEARVIEKSPDLYPFPWIIDIPSEEENRIEEESSTTNTTTGGGGKSTTTTGSSSSGSLAMAGSVDSSDKKTKHNINELYIFKKPLFQLVSQKDVYTLQFSNVEEKLDCLKAVHDAIDEQYKDCKLKDKENRRCPFLNYEKERIQFFSNEKKVSNPYPKEQVDESDTVAQLFTNYSYMLGKDLPKSSSKKKQDEMSTIVNEKVLEELKLKFNSKCIEEQALGAYYATCDCCEADSNLFQLNFHVGDIFILWQKVKKGKKWLLVQKTGLNFSPVRKMQLLDELLPNNLKDMKGVMRKQNLAKKKKPKTPKQIIAITDHYCKIEKEVESDKMYEEIALELNFLSLLSETNFAMSSTSSSKKTSEKDKNEYKNQMRKSVHPSLLGAKKDEYKQNPETVFFKNIFNVSAERGQIGIVPTRVLSELPNQTFKTLITLMEKRDALEEKKIRNFVVAKKSGSTSGANTPSTLSTTSITGGGNSKSNTPTSPGSANAESVDSLQSEKRSRLFSIFSKNK